MARPKAVLGKMAHVRCSGSSEMLLSLTLGGRNVAHWQDRTDMCVHIPVKSSPCQTFIERVGRPFDLGLGLVSQALTLCPDTPCSCPNCVITPTLGLPRGTQGTTGLVSCLSLFLCWCKAGMKPIKSTSENMVCWRKGPGLDSSFSHRNLQLVLVWYLLKMPLMWSLLSHCIPEEETVPVSLSARCTPPECLFQLDRLIAFVLLFMVLQPVFNPHKCSYASQFGFTCQV